MKAKAGEKNISGSEFECGLPESYISYVADFFARATGFSAGGESMDSFVRRIGGRLSYDDERAGRYCCSVDVRGPKDFTVYLTTFVPERFDSLLIAECIGHYVLHSRVGKCPAFFGQDTVTDRSRAEAKAFSLLFLMPRSEFRSRCRHSGDLDAVAVYFDVPLSGVLERRRMLRNTATGKKRGRQK